MHGESDVITALTTPTYSPLLESDHHIYNSASTSLLPFPSLSLLLVLIQISMFVMCVILLTHAPRPPAIPWSSSIYIHNFITTYLYHAQIHRKKDIANIHILVVRLGSSSKLALNSVCNVIPILLTDAV